MDLRYAMKQSSSCCKSVPILPEGKLDARISQKDIGLVYDRISGVYDIWGKLTESRARNRAIQSSPR